MKTHWKKNVDTDYLGSWDLQAPDGSYTEREVLITKVVREMLHDPSNNKKSARNIAHIAGGSKPMVLNSTNCKMMSKLFKSPNVEDWANKRVILHVEKVKAFGELVDSLRIKCKASNQSPAPQPKPEPPAQAPEPLPPCADCKQSIDPHEGVPAEKIAAVSRKRYDVPLCGHCFTARRDAENEETEDTENETNT